MLVLELGQHSLAEDFIDAGEVARAFGFEPRECVGVDADGGLLLYGAKEFFAAHGIGPLVGVERGGVRVFVECAVSLFVEVADIFVDFDTAALFDWRWVKLSCLAYRLLKCLSLAG